MAKNANDIVVVAYSRTAIDKFGGPLRTTHSTDLTIAVMNDLVNKTGINKDQYDMIIHGTALPLETGMYYDIPIRQALLRAGFPDSTLSFTIDRACCSGTTAMQYAWQIITLGEAEIVMATGADNMQNVPLFIDPKYRFEGSRLGPTTSTDIMFAAGYPGFGITAVTAGEIGVEHGITRELCDEWSVRSHDLWGKAFDKNYFAGEIVPFEIPQGKNKPPVVFEKDQMPRPGTNLEALAKLPTVYNGPLVTAGNCPGLNTGATGMIITSRKKAEQLGLEPLARIHKVVSMAESYKNIVTSPANSIKKVLEMNNLGINDVDLIEINEAFAVVPLTSTKLLADGDAGKWDHIRSITNVNGGAIAIGHPLGATGIRISGTLIRELKARGGKYGVAAICGGLAQGDAVLIEVE